MSTIREGRELGGQVPALLELRWSMLRRPRQRWVLIVVASALPLLAIAVVTAGQLAPENYRLNFATISPTIFASFLVLAVVSPASSAGGSELFPSDQLVAFPITHRTVFRSTVLLAPANLAWITSYLALLGVAAYAADRSWRVVLSAITVTTFCAAATVAGQAVAWFLEGVRQRLLGRWLVRAAAATIALVAVAVQMSGNLTTVLDKLPTKPIALSANFGAQGRVDQWAWPVLELLAVTIVALMLGERACGWTLGRVTDGGLQPETRPVRRRTTSTHNVLALMQVDRASVWRSAPLRRGAIVLAVLPGAIAALTEPSWDSLVLLTGLVAAGSGLLFGVNAFGMDGPGALTLEGLPIDPGARFWAKTLVVLEFCATTIGVALVVGAIRADGTPRAPQVAALAAATLATSASVAAFCMKASLASPHRSDLRGRRDTPAPPGAMIAYSARLAWRTTWIAMFLSLTSLTPWIWLPLGVATPMLMLSSRSLIRSATVWRDSGRRSRVISTVASG